MLFEANVFCSRQKLRDMFPRSEYFEYVPVCQSRLQTMNVIHCDRSGAVSVVQLLYTRFRVLAQHQKSLPIRSNVYLGPLKRL